MAFDRISVATVHYPVTVLGPGKRIGLWLQGCNLRCRGCLAPEWQSTKGGLLYPSHLLLEKLLRFCESDTAGITVSGGEPLLQWHYVQPVLKGLLQHHPGLNVILYTGYNIIGKKNGLLTLKNSHEQFTIDPQPVDIVIDGEYIAGAHDCSDTLRGSANQQIHRLTERMTAASVISPEVTGLQLFPEPAGWVSAGIPLQKSVDQGSRGI